MKYIALLRGVNVGTSRRIGKDDLQALFESIGCRVVSTYINSGNIFFESSKSKADLRREAEAAFKNVLGQEVPTLIKTVGEMRRIAKAIPSDWTNDDRQRTDTAYLFDEADSKSILERLPVNKEYVEIRYVKGAVFWRLYRKDYSKSRLNRLVGHELYKSMTIRNVNTARILGGISGLDSRS